MKYFQGVKTFEELRQAYKRLIRQYHPDLNQGQDTTLIMAEIINEYKELEKVISKTKQGKEEKSQYNAINFTEVINSIIGFADINIEIVGSWVWVSGKTYPIRTELAKVGFKFSKKHKKWYMSPTEWDGKKTKLSYEQIKAKYGSERVGRQALG